MQIPLKLMRLSLCALVLVPPVLVGRSLAHAVAARDGDRLVVASVDKGTPGAAPVEEVSSYGMARDDRPPDELRLNLDGRDVVIIYATGDVRLGDGLTVDEASRAFWKRIGELAPTFCRDRAADQSASPQR